MKKAIIILTAILLTTGFKTKKTTKISEKDITGVYEFNIENFKNSKVYKKLLKKHPKRAKESLIVYKTLKFTITAKSMTYDMKVEQKVYKTNFQYVIKKVEGKSLFIDAKFKQDEEQDLPSGVQKAKVTILDNQNILLVFKGHEHEPMYLKLKKK